MLTGMAGVGKTSLANGFARWLVDTGGVSSVYFSTFEHEGSLERVLHQIGWSLMGAKFSILSAEKQRDKMVKYLNEKPCLLIWDNFETVYGFPEGDRPLLSESERKSLVDFLEDIRHGPTYVLVTSRRDERHLGAKKELLKGLNERDAIELAGRILDKVDVDPKELGPAYLDLLRLLNGHPLAMRVVLPYLEHHPPEELLFSLREGLDRFDEADQEEGRDQSLTVSLDYSFSRMTVKAHRHLPILGLFAKYVHVSSLSEFSKSETYAKIFGENLKESDWREILEETHHVGLLTKTRRIKNLFEIHPALPWFLRRKLNQKLNEEQIKMLEDEFIKLYVKVGHSIRYALSRMTQAGLVATLSEEANLLLALRLAESERKWGEAT